MTLIAPVANAAGADQGSSFSNQPLIDGGDSSSVVNAIFRNKYSRLFGASSNSDHTVLAFLVESDCYFVSDDNTSIAYQYSGGSFSDGFLTGATSTGGYFTCSNLDNATGLYYNSYYIAEIPSASNTFVPVFSTFADGMTAASSFLDSAITNAVLVPNGDSFSFGDDYSVNNTTGVDIAVASYNLGANDIIVIGCYETVVVPGTIGGLSANYNVNQTLPREEHIPIRYCSLISDTTFSSLTPYSSLDDAVSACYDLLKDSPNHGGGYTPSDVQFTLQPGNVAYIQMADLSEKVILSSAKSSYSALFQTAGSYWPGNQLYKSGMDYPTAGTVLPGATPNQIPWQKNEWGKENLLGQTKQAYAEITASSNLLMIYNPYYQGDDSSTLTNSNLINSSIVISSKGIARNGIRVYNLQDSFSTVDGNYYYGIGSTNPNGYGDYFQSENDPNATNPDVTGWTDQNGDPTTAPGVTPYNDPPENDSIADVISKFISNITGLFTQGHEAIKTLSENASEFVSHLSELYSWLPPQVLAVLTSAIILAIIIGVLKVFL